MYQIWNTITNYCNKQSFLRWLFVDSNGHVQIIQWLNIPLWIAVVLGTLTRLTSGGVSNWAGYGETLTLAYWAIGEIFWGASRFRRLLGLVVLSGEVMALLHGLP